MTVSTLKRPSRRSTLEPELVDPVRDARFRRIHVIALLMDDAFEIPGTNRRIGWDALIGIVPGIGDAASAAVSAWLVYEARKLGLPKWKLARMVANIGTDTVLGIVPFVGDLFDCAFKANRKNAQIVKDHFQLKTPVTERRSV